MKDRRERASERERSLSKEVAFKRASDCCCCDGNSKREEEEADRFNAVRLSIAAVTRAREKEKECVIWRSCCCSDLGYYRCKPF